MRENRYSLYDLLRGTSNLKEEIQLCLHWSTVLRVREINILSMTLARDYNKEETSIRYNTSTREMELKFSLRDPKVSHVEMC